ncbi:hypothetical protein [Acinetobacter baumannii]|uniref:hypothetical protein n=1 Tax=Acinetobacter baumannii TaxID=470 RepID=UPI003B435AFF
MLQRIKSLSSNLHSLALQNDSLHSGKDYISKRVEEILVHLKFLSLKGKENVLNRLNTLVDRLVYIKNLYEEQQKRVNLGEIDSVDIGGLYDFVSELDGFGEINLEGLEYNSNIVLLPEEVKNIIKQIIDRYPNIKISEELPSQYNQASLDERTLISEKIILLRNESINPKSTGEETYIKNLAFELNMIVSAIGLNEKIKRLDNNIQITELQKYNSSIESIRKIETGYELEANKLLTQINELRSWVESGFYLIISIIILKLLIYYSIKPENFFKLPDILLSLSIVFISTAFLTYLIKERNRLIRLHDQYNKCDLELKSITSYMNELTQEQRQEILMKLSDNYFRGPNQNNESYNNQSNEIENIMKSISDLTKLVSEIKGSLK